MGLLSPLYTQQFLLRGEWRDSKWLYLVDRLGEKFSNFPAI